MPALDKKPKKTLDHHILAVVRENNPKTVEKLIELVQLKHPIPQREILTRISDLQNRGQIVLREHQAPSGSLLRSHILSTKAVWYWTIITVATITAALIFTIPESAYPTAYARHLSGAIFVLFLPGYSLVKVLFPTKELDTIETTALSIGLSLTLVSLIGILLHYTPWGIGTASATLSLLVITTILATVSFIREHQARPKNTFEGK